MAKGIQISFLGHEIEDEELFTDSKERVPKRSVSMSNKLSTAKQMIGIMFGTKSKLQKRRNRILTFDLLKDRNFNSSKDCLITLCPIRSICILQFKLILLFPSFR